MAAETWVVTGANRGIGLALAGALAADGHTVIATARRPEAADDLAALDVRVEPLDVADGASVARFAQTLEGVGVDALVNNAGIGHDHRELGALDYDELERFFRVNTLGALRVTEALLPGLRARDRRLVVNVTSKMGSMADNTSGSHYGYRPSKAALNMVTVSLALDLAGERFTCVALHPGWVRTDMGGTSAPLDVAESAHGMLEVVRRMGPAESGTFIDFRGDRIGW